MRYSCNTCDAEVAFEATRYLWQCSNPNCPHGNQPVKTPSKPQWIRLYGQKNPIMIEKEKEEKRAIEYANGSRYGRCFG